MTTTAATTCKVRYSQGPDQVSFGPLILKRGEWSAPITQEQASEIMRPGHVESLGLEADGYTPPADPTPATTPAPAAAATTAGKATTAAKKE